MAPADFLAGVSRGFYFVLGLWYNLRRFVEVGRAPRARCLRREKEGSEATHRLKRS